MLDNVTNGIKAWLVGRFASAINHTTRPEDRVLAIRWLSQSRDVVASNVRSIEKLKQLNALIIPDFELINLCRPSRGWQWTRCGRAR